jgi:hypothetical protein
MPRVRLICAAIFLAAPLFGQTTVTGTLKVQRGDALLPLPGCVVFANSIDNGPLVGEYSDDKGRFVLGFPPDARVTVGAECPGHRMIAVDGRRSSMTTYDCSNAGTCAEVELTVEPLAVVEGMVLNPHGMPAEGMQLGLRPANQTMRGRGGRQYMAISDDRGYFRFFHLLPGPYVLELITRGGPFAGLNFQTEAVPIELQPGDVEAGVQVQLRLVESVPFTGRIQGLPPGTKRVYLRFTGQRGQVQNSSGRTVEVDEEGRFRIDELVPGQYDFEVSLPDEENKFNFNEGNLAHLGTAEVGSSGGEAVFSRRAPIRVTGALSIQWPERDLPGPREGMPLHLTFVEESGYSTGAAAQPPDYRFEVPRLRAGRYRLRTPGFGAKVERRVGAAEWQPFGELAVNEGDSVELDLRVRFEVGRLSVAVRPADRHYVVGIRSNGITRLFPTDQNGLLEIDFFPGGDYQICAWPDISQEEADDPETWRKLGEAVREFQHSEGVDMEISLTAAP